MYLPSQAISRGRFTGCSKNRTGRHHGGVPSAIQVRTARTLAGFARQVPADVPVPSCGARRWTRRCPVMMPSPGLESWRSPRSRVSVLASTQTAAPGCTENAYGKVYRVGCACCKLHDRRAGRVQIHGERWDVHHRGTESTEDLMLVEEELTSKILGAALEVHKVLGPGLLESAYEESLCHELGLRAPSTLVLKSGEVLVALAVGVAVVVDVALAVAEEQDRRRLRRPLRQRQRVPQVAVFPE